MEGASVLFHREPLVDANFDRGRTSPLVCTHFDRERRAPLICNRFNVGRRAVDEGSLREVFFSAESCSSSHLHPFRQREIIFSRSRSFRQREEGGEEGCSSSVSQCQHSCSRSFRQREEGSPFSHSSISVPRGRQIISVSTLGEGQSPFQLPLFQH